MTTPIAAGPLDRRVGHQPRATEDGHCRRECPYMEAWSHPFWHQTAWCWKQMRDLAYYDGLIADCLHRTPDENLARLPVEMMPNAKSEPTAPLLAQVGSTDGLGVAVPPAPTIDEEIGNG